MISYLIISKQKEKRKTYVSDFCQDQNISIFDRVFIDRDASMKQNTQSIGIDDIKTLKKTIFLKPVDSKMKIVFIDDGELLTIEAQNALLKILEEPPLQTGIIIGVNTEDTILQTIISRCKIISLDTENPTIDIQDIAEFDTFMKTYHLLTISQRLKKAETLSKNREEALVWVEKLIIFLHDDLLKQQSFSKQTIIDLKNFQQLYTTLKATNTNPRFAIEHTFLKDMHS